MNFYTQQHKHYCGIDLHARARFLIKTPLTEQLSEDGGESAKLSSMARILPTPALRNSPSTKVRTRLTREPVWGDEPVPGSSCRSHRGASCQLRTPNDLGGGKEIGLRRLRTHFLIGDIIGDGLGLLVGGEVGGCPVHADDRAQPTALPAGGEREGREREEGRVPDFQASMKFVHALQVPRGAREAARACTQSGERIDWL